MRKSETYRELELIKILMKDLRKAGSSEMTEFVLAQNLFRFYHPKVDGADK